MKKVLLLLCIITISNTTYGSSLPCLNLCKKWASKEKYDIDLLFLESIWIKEGKVTNRKQKSKKNSDGSYDIGYFQINSYNFDYLSKKLGIKDLTQSNQNIMSACYLIYSNRVELKNKGIEVNIFTQAAMYNNPKLFYDYWENGVYSFTVDYALEVERIYNNIKN